MTAKITESMREALVQLHEAKHVENFRATTVRGLERRGLITKSEGLSGQSNFVLTSAGMSVVNEQINQQRPSRSRLRWVDSMARPTVDIGRTDYAFWDGARLGKIKGLGMAGMLLKPLSSKKASWVLGLPLTVRYDDEGTQEAVNGWIRDFYADLIRAYREAGALGDAFIVINPPDETGRMTPTVVPPHVVERIYANDDYSKGIGWQIKQVYRNPNEGHQAFGAVQEIIDEFYADRRVRTVKMNGKLMKRTVYRNYIGMPTIVHIKSNVGINELFGRPDGEGMLKLLYHFDTVLEVAVEGNVKQGRPTPTFQKMGSRSSVDAFWEAFGRDETHDMPDGTRETVRVIDFSSDDAVILGDNGEFRYESPGSFTQDTRNLFDMFYRLVVLHTEIPEFIWGNAISSSRASAETQMEPFVRWVEGLQASARHWIMQVATIVGRMMALYGEAKDIAPKSVEWQPLTKDNGELTLKAIDMALRNGLIDDETALRLMPLDVDNPIAVLQQARLERQLARDAMLNDYEPFTPTLDMTDEDEQVDQATRNLQANGAS